MRIRLPEEHGAWGILLVPLVSSALVARGEWFPFFLTFACALGLFILRGSFEQTQNWREVLSPSHGFLALVCLCAAWILILGYARTQLIPLAALGLVLFAALRFAVNRHQANSSEKRSLTAELIGVLLLTLTAPATWIAQRGALDSVGLRVWLLNVLFFAGGVLYVKFRVRGLLAHRRFDGVRERAEFAWPVFAYHLLLVVFLAALVARNSLSAGVFVAFTPAILRASGLFFQLGRKFPIKRLGWSEVGHSILFAVLLFVAFR